MLAKSMAGAAPRPEGPQTAAKRRGRYAPHAETHRRERRGRLGAELRCGCVRPELVSEVEQLKLERGDRQSDMLGLSAAA